MKTSIFFFWLSFLSLLVSAQVDTSNLSPADRKYLQACLGNADFRELAPNYDNATINFSRRFHPWELSPTEIWNYKTLKFSVMPINDSVAVRKNSRYFHNSLKNCSDSIITSLDFFDSFTGIYLFSIDAEYSVVSFVGLVGNKYYDQDFNFWVNTERGFIRRLKRIQRQATRGDYSPLSLDRFYARLLADSRTYLRAIYPYLKIRRKI